MTTKQVPSDQQEFPGAMRASDAERERAVEALRKHYETGHIGYAEFNERMEQAYQATHTHQLTALVADLPGGYAQQPGVPAVAPPPATAAPKQRMGWGKIAAIAGLVLAAMVGLSWITGFITSHPVIALGATAVLVWLIVRKSSHRRS